MHLPIFLQLSAHWEFLGMHMTNLFSEKKLCLSSFAHIFFPWYFTQIINYVMYSLMTAVQFPVRETHLF